MRPSAVLLIVLCITIVLPLLLRGAAAATATIPLKTDDGLDPVNLIFTGYAPAWWVVQNIYGWNATPCSEAKTLDGRTYDFTLETPDTRDQAPLPCYGPRFHVRVWDMGVDPILGHWSLGAVHHEHSVCNPFPFCHHIIDGWEIAEQQIRSTFTLASATASVTNYTLPNGGSYQNYYNDGNAALIRLSSPSTYPISFTQTGLRPGSPWSVTLNRTTSSSTSNTILFSEPNGTYTFTVVPINGYASVPTSGILQVNGNLVSQPVEFTPLEYYVNFSESGLAPGTPWSVILDGIAQQSTGKAITFQVSKGTHQFTVQDPQGYTSKPSRGSIVVGSDTTIQITYDATIQAALSQPSAAFLIYTTISAWAIVATAAIITVARRRKPGRSDDRTISE